MLTYAEFGRRAHLQLQGKRNDVSRLATPVLSDSQQKCLVQLCSLLGLDHDPLSGDWITISREGISFQRFGTNFGHCGQIEQ
jgi:hypothetical protein